MKILLNMFKPMFTLLFIINNKMDLLLLLFRKDHKWEMKESETTNLNHQAINNQVNSKQVSKLSKFIPCHPTKEKYKSMMNNLVISLNLLQEVKKKIKNHLKWQKKMMTNSDNIIKSNLLLHLLLKWIFLVMTKTNLDKSFRKLLLNILLQPMFSDTHHRVKRWKTKISNQSWWQLWNLLFSRLKLMRVLKVRRQKKKNIQKNRDIENDDKLY